MTVLATEPRDMATKKPADNKGKRDDIAVKVDRTLADKAKLVASRRRITMAQYLSDLIRNPVERDFTKTVRELEGKPQ